MLQDGVAKALAEKCLIAHKHVSRTQLASLQLADKPLGLGKRSHQRMIFRTDFLATNLASRRSFD